MTWEAGKRRDTPSATWSEQDGFLLANPLKYIAAGFRLTLSSLHHPTALPLSPAGHWKPEGLCQGRSIRWGSHGLAPFCWDATRYDVASCFYLLLHSLILTTSTTVLLPQFSPLNTHGCTHMWTCTHVLSRELVTLLDKGRKELGEKRS